MVRDSALILCLLLPASLGDLRCFRVSNSVILYGLILSLGFRIGMQGAWGLIGFFIGLAIPFILCFILYRLGALGASDVKLFSVICCNYDFEMDLKILMYSFCVGAFFACIHMLRYGNLSKRIRYFYQYIFQCIAGQRVTRYMERTEQTEELVIPFAVCISLGTMVAMLCG